VHINVDKRECEKRVQAFAVGSREKDASWLEAEGEHRVDWNMFVSVEEKAR
jgi:hypothetical protein